MILKCYDDERKYMRLHYGKWQNAKRKKLDRCLYKVGFPFADDDVMKRVPL